VPATSAAQDPAPRIVALIPAHDEARGIGQVVASTVARLAAMVVDDGSADATAEIAEQAGAHVIRQVPNQGKGAALRTGFRSALEDGVDAVITLDGDGQHDPAEIQAFLQAYERESEPGRPMELLIGRRAFRQMPPVRRLSNWLGTIVLSTAVGRWIPDNQSGYRLIGRRLMAAMLESRESGFAFEVEMIAVCLREGWPLSWVPIRTIYGGETSHIRPLRHLREFLGVTGRARRIARGAAVAAAEATPISE
jgi:glycosyltransferase involved in cell wall biosynthesis